MHIEDYTHMNIYVHTHINVYVFIFAPYIYIYNIEQMIGFECYNFLW